VPWKWRGAFEYDGWGVVGAVLTARVCALKQWIFDQALRRWRLIDGCALKMTGCLRIWRVGCCRSGFNREGLCFKIMDLRSDTSKMTSDRRVCLRRWRLIDGCAFEDDGRGVVGAVLTARVCALKQWIFDQTLRRWRLIDGCALKMTGCLRIWRVGCCRSGFNREGLCFKTMDLRSDTSKMTSDRRVCLENDGVPSNMTGGVL